MPDRTPSSHPAVDPLDATTAWLSAHSFCDPQCTENHPAPHSMVSAAEAEARTARMFASEYKRERDEHECLLIHGIQRLRELAERSPVPPAGDLLSLATELEQEL